MKSETTKTVAPGVTLTDGVMVVDEAAMRRDFAMSCANALKAMHEGYRDLAEEVARFVTELREANATLV